MSRHGLAETTTTKGQQGVWVRSEAKRCWRSHLLSHHHLLLLVSNWHLQLSYVLTTTSHLQQDLSSVAFDLQPHPRPEPTSDECYSWRGTVDCCAMDEASLLRQPHVPTLSLREPESSRTPGPRQYRHSIIAIKATQVQDGPDLNTALSFLSRGLGEDAGRVA